MDAFGLNPVTVSGHRELSWFTLEVTQGDHDVTRVHAVVGNGQVSDPVFVHDKTAVAVRPPEKPVPHGPAGDVVIDLPTLWWCRSQAEGPELRSDAVLEILEGIRHMDLQRPARNPSPTTSTNPPSSIPPTPSLSRKTSSIRAGTPDLSASPVPPQARPEFPNCLSPPPKTLLTSRS
jgi:hypothetical protein